MNECPPRWIVVHSHCTIADDRGDAVCSPILRCLVALLSPVAEGRLVLAGVVLCAMDSNRCDCTIDRVSLRARTVVPKEMHAA